MKKLESLKAWIRESKNIVFFGGAGVSTESGIPDFRSVDGLYRQTFEYPPEEIISHSFYCRNPEYFFKFYKEKMLHLDFEPNVTHKTIARWEAEGKNVIVVTQNIDGLHQKAGSKHVFELHGSVHRNYCPKCAACYDGYYIRDSVGVPKCECGGIVKPDVVLFEEPLNNDTFLGSMDAISQAELMIVAGTSLTVHPAASLLQYFRGNKLVLINRDVTAYDDRAGLVFHESLGDIFSKL